jgi:hypothetical protein
MDWRERIVVDPKVMVGKPIIAISCGISDRELATKWDLISFTKGSGSRTSGDSGAGVPAGQEEEEARCEDADDSF